MFGGSSGRNVGRGIRAANSGMTRWVSVERRFVLGNMVVVIVPTTPDLFGKNVRNHFQKWKYKVVCKTLNQEQPSRQANKI